MNTGPVCVGPSASRRRRAADHTRDLKATQRAANHDGGRVLRETLGGGLHLVLFPG